ncbi:hypothetical protein EMMF5_002053 [Cystobasidiomycetes sp. EMM_F5]
MEVVASTADDGCQRYESGHPANSRDLAGPNKERKIRFVDYCAVIPELDEASVAKAAANQGRPRLATRTYSLLLPSIFSHAQEALPGIHDNVTTSPTSQTTISLKLPTITKRKRASTAAAASPSIKGCLKNGKTDSCSTGGAAWVVTSASQQTTSPPVCEAPKLGTTLTAARSLPSGEMGQLVPLSPCCVDCHRGTDFGFLPSQFESEGKPSQSVYYEQWTPTAKARRARSSTSSSDAGKVHHSYFDGNGTRLECIDELESLRKTGVSAITSPSLSNGLDDASDAASCFSDLSLSTDKRSEGSSSVVSPSPPSSAESTASSIAKRPRNPDGAEKKMGMLSRSRSADATFAEQRGRLETRHITYTSSNDCGSLSPERSTSSGSWSKWLGGFGSGMGV